jgi:hypothetical protein
MYSWENNNNDYKYETIQHYAPVESYSHLDDELEISLDEMLELEDEIEMEELEGEIYA